MVDELALDGQIVSEGQLEPSPSDGKWKLYCVKCGVEWTARYTVIASECPDGVCKLMRTTIDVQYQDLAGNANRDVTTTDQSAVTSYVRSQNTPNTKNHQIVLFI